MIPRNPILNKLHICYCVVYNFFSKIHFMKYRNPKRVLKLAHEVHLALDAGLEWCGDSQKQTEAYDILGDMCLYYCWLLDRQLDGLEKCGEYETSYRRFLPRLTNHIEYCKSQSSTFLKNFPHR